MINRKPSQHQSNIIALVFLSLMLFLGIGIMVYPLISSAYMARVQSGIQTQYHEQIKKSNTEQLGEIRKSAEEYNERLARGELSMLTPAENGYFEQMLIPGGSDIMGYIRIPKIRVSLPIYHGVGNDALSAGCGHMPQSSLPIGGISTHAVISAHTGMANSPMFSDLPLLEPGDQFQLDILGETLTYQIQSENDIQIVLPVEVQAIQIKNGADLCTLVTCTPFGVNTHRLLVTGHRIATPETADTNFSSEEQPHNPESSSVWEEEYWKSLKIGICTILFISAAAAAGLFAYHYRKRGKYQK